MAFNGAGAFIRTDGVRSGADLHVQQRDASVKVRADLTDAEAEDMATGMELAVLRDGQNAASANLPMATFKHTNVATGSGSSSRSEYASSATVQDGAIHDAGLTGGSTTVYTATLSPAITAYAAKQLFRVQFDQTCGATPTLNLNGVGAKKIYWQNGTSATQITTGDLVANFVALLRYDTALDSAAGAFWLLNPPPALAITTTYAASTTVVGKVELATTAETTTGTDTARAVTPAGLAGSIWIPPIGCVVDFGAASAPSGWLLCYGQNVSRTTYAALFAVISTTFGVGDGSTTFGIPDYRGRTGIGKDDMGGSAASRVTNGTSGVDAATLGAAGGDQRQQSHSHTYTRDDPGTVAGGAAAANTVSTGGVATSTTGAGSSQNMQPSIVVTKIIFAGV